MNEITAFHLTIEVLLKFYLDFSGNLQEVIKPEILLRKKETPELSHKKKIPNLDILFCLLSARRGSNPRPRPWQGRALPTEPLAHVSNTSDIILNKQKTVKNFFQKIPDNLPVQNKIMH